MSFTLNEVDRKTIKAAINEMVYCLERIDGEKEQMKDITASLEEKYGIKKKFFSKLAATTFKHNFADIQKESEHFEFLYESVIANNHKQS